MREQNWKNLDSQKIQEYMSYYNSYYGADFQPGQGLDEITDMISRYSLHGTWVDLGGGTSTFIWLPAFEKITEAHSIDKYAESSYVHEYVRRLSPSGCYSHILNRYGRSICEMKRIPITYSQLDLLSDFAADEKYDNVSQFGLLGLCRSKQEYIKRLGMLSRFMGNRSIFFGSNWVFSMEYAKAKGFSNSYLDTALIDEYILAAKKTLLYSARIPIINDPSYDAVLIYAFTA